MRILDNVLALQLVDNIRNGIDVEQSYNKLVEMCEHILKWFLRKYSPIIQKYDLIYDDVKQEMYIGLLQAVKNCPVDCKNFYNWLMSHLRGICLNYFKFNTNRITPHSENKEKRLEEFKSFSLNDNINEENEYLDLLEYNDSSINDFLEHDYNKYIYAKLKDFLYYRFDNINVDLYFDFYKLTFDELEHKYKKPILNIMRYCTFITTVLKTDYDFKIFCEKYLEEIITERRFKQWEYQNKMNGKIDVAHLLNDEIITEFSHTSMLNFEIGKDVKIHNYFRVRFPQQNLI